MVQYEDGKPTKNPEKFEGQDSLGALWVPINDITPGNSSPLVVQAIEWLKTEQLSFEIERLDDWVVLRSNTFN